jgi:uncharacterized protein YwgA
MTRYQLAKIVDWAGTLQSRKRMQKVIYLLGAAGCPLENDFGLHLFGPYSPEVAGRADEMTSLGLLREERVGNFAGQQFNYSLTKETKARLSALEATPEGQTWAQELAPYEARAKELLATDVRELEVGATIVYFRRRGYDWSEAVSRTCNFKGLENRDALVRRAEALAHSILP